jgi:hypothetical protein
MLFLLPEQKVRISRRSIIIHYLKQRCSRSYLKYARPACCLPIVRDFEVRYWGGLH